MSATVTSSRTAGSVGFLQFFGSSLVPNPHLHMMFLDGVFASGKDGCTMRRPLIGVKIPKGNRKPPNPERESWTHGGDNMD